MSRARWVFAIALGLCGCSRADAAYGGEGSNGLGSSDPPRAGVGCQMMLWTRITAQSRLSYTLSVVAENTTDHLLDLPLPDACPSGSFLFEGLPDGYDIYQICKAGACPSAGAKNVSLAVGARRVLASATIDAAGGGCNHPLESQLYRVRALAPPATFRICTEAASLDLRRVKIPANAPPQPITPAPAPPEKAASDFYTCARSSDCVIACPRVVGCCGNVCGCQNAVRRDQVAAFEQYFAGTCSRPPNCPSVDCGYVPAYTAECRNGRCAAAREPGL